MLFIHCLSYNLFHYCSLVAALFQLFSRHVVLTRTCDTLVPESPKTGSLITFEHVTEPRAVKQIFGLHMATPQI